MSRRVSEILAVLAVLLAAATVAVSDTAARRTVLRWSGYLIDGRTGATTCPVHGVPLADAMVPIAYGLIMPSRPEDSARARKEYPFAQEWAGGGCMVGRARWALVDRCPRCMERRQAIHRQLASAAPARTASSPSPSPTR